MMTTTAVVTGAATAASGDGCECDDSNGGRRRSLFSFLSPASWALSDNNCRSHVGIQLQNLAQSGNLEIVARIWHGCPDTRARFFWKSKNLEQKINLEQGSPNLAMIWQQSGNNLATKKMEKTHLAQFKKPPIGWLLVRTPVPDFFGNLKIWHKKLIWHGGSPNLAMIWQRSGKDLEMKKMEKTHLEQFKKPPNRSFPDWGDPCSRFPDF
jgi:hypothetical protein